jgi:hypothetical protein
MGMFLTSLAAYAVAAATFALHLGGTIRNDAAVIAVVTCASWAGLILNGLGVLAAIAGLAKDDRKWVCLVALLLNLGPPLTYLGVVLLGRVFNE